FARPEPALGWAARLAGAGAAIDISDGLVQDLQHVLDASGGLGARIHVSKLPVNGELSELDDDDRLALQLSGGDDYLLLFTWPAGHPLPDRAWAIGEVTGPGSLQIIAEDGRLKMPPPGWRHF